MKTESSFMMQKQRRICSLAAVDRKLVERESSDHWKEGKLRVASVVTSATVAIVELLSPSAN